MTYFSKFLRNGKEAHGFNYTKPTSILPTTSTSGQSTLTFTTPIESDITSYIILRSTSPISDNPVEGSTYATSTTIGASTVACSLICKACSSVNTATTGSPLMNLSFSALIKNN